MEVALAVAPARVSDFVELTKPRITFLVLVTTAVGYALGVGASFHPAVFVSLLVGTALVSGGASALNQWAERDADARMARTASRPLPSGRLAPADALVFGLVISAVGVVLLAGAVNLLTGLLALGSLSSYVLAYTPLKRVTSLCTLVGAVPGAIPPMMGWAAARGSLGREALALFGVLFLWQLPHFLSIAWIYRDDYARAGFPMLPVNDPGGASTARQSVAYAAALVPVTLLAGAVTAAGERYLWGAVALGALFVGCTIAFAFARSVKTARWVFLVSVLYLPAVLGLMVLDR
ncbi:MAG TPA: heme o synthase [Thermoanaerobaculia bacterium]|nr:heme o synthase [Thermoanaerobaculia bacterium]HEV8611565.1 heme o synthase [Thermoanaerobaculia bacterium]